MSRIELLLHKRRLIAGIAALGTELDEVNAKLQALCDHEWVWHQVAGEGRICKICKLHDRSED